MAVQKGPCDYCNSSDNLATWDSGSQYCFTADCEFNKIKGEKRDDIPKELIQGLYAPLAERRISQRTCEVFGYMQGLYNNIPCHIANIYDDKKNLKAQQIRLPDKQFRMLGDVADLGLVGKHLWGATGRSVVITEGYIDMLSIAETQDCKWPVVTVPNGAASAEKAIKRDLAWLMGFENVILCFDNDEAGQRATETCVLLFPPGKVKIAKLSEKDANDVLVKGKGKELVNIVFTAAEYRPDGIIAGSEIDLEEIFVEDPIGLTLPYPLLNETIRGLKKGRIYTVYAGSGNGKTTFMKECMYHIRLKHPEIKIGNIFLEESKNYTIKSYIAMDNNIPTYMLEENKNVLTTEQKQKSAAKLLSQDPENERMYFYKHFGSLDAKRLFGLLEYLAIGKGVQLIALDHISILISGLEVQNGNERQSIDFLMTQLRSFAERTGCIILLATQLKRTEGSYNSGATINEASARGSGAIEHLSDAIISLNCNQESESPNDAQIKVLKNRISGMKGNVDLITYNSKTGRYLVKHNTEHNINHKKIGSNIRTIKEAPVTGSLTREQVREAVRSLKNQEEDLI